MKNPSPHIILSLLLLGSLIQQAHAQEVRINFNNLPAGTIVTNQYLPHVTFSGNGFSAGSMYPNGSDNVLRSLNFYEPYNGGIDSREWYWYTRFGDTVSSGPTYVDFKLPVNNLSFYILNSHNYYRIVDIYIWVNRQYFGVRQVQGTGYLGASGPPIFVDLGSIPNITGIQITNSSNCDFTSVYTNRCWPVIYDDFTFTPDLNVNITNPEISGNLQGTTQKALIGADVTLEASANRSGGAYTWNVAGPNQRISTSADAKKITVRWTETGTHRVTVNYTLSGITVTSYVDVNVVIPKLTAFTANQVPDEINRDRGCTNFYPGATHTVGCWQNVTDTGIIYTATATIPSGQYLSNLNQSGIKFLQAVNVFRKRVDNGNMLCRTNRRNQSETEFDTGWQLDTSDPYNHDTSEHRPRRFSEGLTLTMRDFDAPGHRLDGELSDGTPFSYDAYYVKNTYAMYVFYFVGDIPGSPVFQRAIGLENSSLPYARIIWTFGAQASFNFGVNFLKYKRDFTTTSTGQIPAEAVGTVADMSSNVLSLSFVTCPGTTATTNPIDGSAFFVKNHYYDFLQRNDPVRDQGGYDFWRTQISQCGFNTGCVAAYRAAVSRAFWDSTDFQKRTDVIASGLVNPPGSARPYDNRQFVRWCYKLYLLREPDQAGWDFWFNDLNRHGDYNQIIKAFLLSTDYRARFIAP